MRAKSHPHLARRLGVQAQPLLQGRPWDAPPPGAVATPGGTIRDAAPEPTLLPTPRGSEPPPPPRGSAWPRPSPSRALACPPRALIALGCTRPGPAFLLRMPEPGCCTVEAVYKVPVYCTELCINRMRSRESAPGAGVTLEPQRGHAVGTGGWAAGPASPGAQSWCFQAFPLFHRTLGPRRASTESPEPPGVGAGPPLDGPECLTRR